MSTELLINVTPRETRIALIEQGILQELFIDRASCRGILGNIYRGKVKRVLPGMQASFIEADLERAAFLHAADIVNKSTPNFDVDEPKLACNKSAEEELSCEKQKENESQKGGCPDITELVREGQELLVQVIKDPIGTKGARLTTHISLPSRYVVYMPYNDSIGVSQRIESDDERNRLRKITTTFLTDYKKHSPDPNEGLPEHYPFKQRSHGGFIIRTSAENLPEEHIIKDLEFITQLWKSIQRNVQANPEKRIIHEELPLMMRTLREIIRTDIERVRVDSKLSHQKVKDFVVHFLPDMETRIEHYDGNRPIFDIYGVEDEIQQALKRRVPLKSGGYLIIDQTEAMTTIDINTGAYVGKRNLEETIFKTNLEATHAVARQLRLRNLGGMIIIDFIDMCNEDHKRTVLRTLENCLEKDNTKTAISEVSTLGLVQMTRKRTRESMEHILCEECPTCHGRGSTATSETVCYQIFRDLIRESRQYGADKMLVLASRDVVDRLMEQEAETVTDLESFLDTPIEIQVEPMYTNEQFDIVLM